MSKNKAFTLIELLVVISIIALLIGLLMPALSSAKKSARMSLDLNNVRQWGTSTHAYSLDYQGLFPPGSEGNPGVTWVWYAQKQWEIMRDDYGVLEESGCNSLEVGPPEYMYKDNYQSSNFTVIGWVYFGNRPAGSSQDKYISPKRIEDVASASSATLFNCFHFNQADLGGSWESVSPHTEGGNGDYSWIEAGQPWQKPEGLSTAYIDGSARFVYFDELSRFRNSDYLYYDAGNKKPIAPQPGGSTGTGPRG